MISWLKKLASGIEEMPQSDPMLEADMHDVQEGEIVVCDLPVEYRKAYLYLNVQFKKMQAIAKEIKEAGPPADEAKVRAFMVEQNTFHMLENMFWYAVALHMHATVDRETLEQYPQGRVGKGWKLIGMPMQAHMVVLGQQGQESDQDQDTADDDDMPEPPQKPPKDKRRLN